jgi:hypothetical protein
VILHGSNLSRSGASDKPGAVQSEDHVQRECGHDLGFKVREHALMWSKAKPCDNQIVATRNKKTARVVSISDLASQSTMLITTLIQRSPLGKHAQKLRRGRDAWRVHNL